MATDTVEITEWDIVVIVLYFAIIMAVGIFASVRANRNSAEGFFLAGKSITVLPLAGSIYATNIGAMSFVGLAGSGAKSGFASVMFEWHATYTLIMLGWIFVPIYIASGTFTMPEYLQKRFGRKRIRVFYAIIQMIWTVLSGISSEIYAGTIFFEEMLGWDVYLSTIVILGISAIYTLGGGLAAVIYTDALQTIVLVTGAFVVTILALIQVGGYEQIMEQFLKAASNSTFLDQALYWNHTCGFPPNDSFHIFRGMDSDYPWPGLVFGLTLLATYYWCTNQVIVQRNLAAKTMSHSKGACVIASYLKLLPFVLFTLPGMISRILYPNKIACATPDLCKLHCNDPAGCTNVAYPTLVMELLPEGVRGLMLAAMLAALMSSLTSQFNSSSSVFVMDLWLYARRKASQFEIVLVGRLFGLFMIGLSIAWLPILQAIQGGSLWDYIQSVASYITPPWVVAFMLGMFWARLTEEGMWWGLVAGMLTGVVRMAIEFSYKVPRCGSGDEDLRPNILKDVHYTMFALIMFGVTMIVCVAISVVTPPRRKNQLHRVTWWTRHDVEIPELTDYDTQSSDDEEEEEEGKRRSLEGVMENSVVELDEGLETAVKTADRQSSASNKSSKSSKSSVSSSLSPKAKSASMSSLASTKSTNKVVGCLKKAYSILCGVSDIVPPKMSKAEKAAQWLLATNIVEDPKWALVCDINGVIAIAATSFVIGFYY